MWRDFLLNPAPLDLIHEQLFHDSKRERKKQA